MSRLSWRCYDTSSPNLESPRQKHIPPPPISLRTISHRISSRDKLAPSPGSLSIESHPNASPDLELPIPDDHWLARQIHNLLSHDSGALHGPDATQRHRERKHD
jgi:hypothetical protein